MCARLISRLNAAIDFASFDFGHLETLEKVRGRIGFSILRPTHSRFLPARFNSLANVPLHHVKFINRKKISHPFLFQRQNKTLQNSRINRKKNSKVWLFFFNFLQKKKKDLKLSYRRTSIRRDKPSRRKMERERKEGEVGEVARGVADESEGAKKKVGPVNGTWFKAKYYDRGHISRTRPVPMFTLAPWRGGGEGWAVSRADMFATVYYRDAGMGHALRNIDLMRE